MMIMLQRSRQPIIQYQSYGAVLRRYQSQIVSLDGKRVLGIGELDFMDDQEQK